jgi:hypothetical protein
VAQKMLFSKDRNPNVPIEPPPPPPPKPKMPALPVYYGQIGLGDPVVLLSMGGEQQSYHVGDKIGPFKVLAFDAETIAFEWNDERVEKKIADIQTKDDTPPPQPQTFRAPAPPAAKPAASSAVTRIGNDTDAAGKQDKGPLGIDMGAGFFSCKDGDTTPNGAVVNGFKKIISHGLFGEICHWEQIK